MLARPCAERVEIMDDRFVSAYLLNEMTLGLVDDRPKILALRDIHGSVNHSICTYERGGLFR